MVTVRGNLRHQISLNLTEVEWRNLTLAPPCTTGWFKVTDLSVLRSKLSRIWSGITFLDSVEGPKWICSLKLECFLNYTRTRWDIINLEVSKDEEFNYLSNELNVIEIGQLIAQEPSIFWRKTTVKIVKGFWVNFKNWLRLYTFAGMDLCT